ncbi:hypothetical protein [Winogradskyella sp. R77965]|uniref:hypothetical protein n=1 Tax=Winogradskyella sp. R77965 TaxID=3093872 RepID=UPI0037DD6DAB
MNKPIRNAIIIVTFLVFIPLLLFKSCIIQNTKPEDCEIVTSKIIELREGPSFDIGFTGDKGETFYINRGIEAGLNLDSLNAKVLNKTVTLHLAKIMGGVTSRHIAQLALNDEVIYSEFEN